MSRYDKVYERRARRAVEQGAIDLQTFMEDLVASGVSPDRIEDMLLDDLENEGPVFGKFIRSLTGAATSTVNSAERQGDMAGVALVNMEEDPEYQRLIGFSLRRDEGRAIALRI